MQIARCALWYIVVGSPLEYLPCVVYRTMLMRMIELHSKVLQGAHDDYNSFNNRQ